MSWQGCPYICLITPLRSTKGPAYAALRVDVNLTWLFLSLILVPWPFLCHYVHITVGFNATFVYDKVCLFPQNEVFCSKLERARKGPCSNLPWYFHQFKFYLRMQEDKQSTLMLGNQRKPHSIHSKKYCLFIPFYFKIFIPETFYRLKHLGDFILFLMRINKWIISFILYSSSFRRYATDGARTRFGGKFGGMNQWVYSVL